MRAHTEYRGGEWSEVVVVSYKTVLTPGGGCGAATSVSLYPSPATTGKPSVAMKSHSTTTAVILLMIAAVTFT